jgi:hypothetical protein
MWLVTRGAQGKQGVTTPIVHVMTHCSPARPPEAFPWRGSLGSFGDGTSRVFPAFTASCNAPWCK